MELKPYRIEKYAPNHEITGAFDKSLAAKCENGTFVGYLEDDVLAFKGIPFATQPVGKLRWKLPEPVAASDKVFEAYHSGKTSIQPPNMLDPDLSYEMGEDCLTLNIYTNITDKSEKKAVMVWIHGGAWLSGGNSSPNYDGYNFISENKDVILVTINYRLGIMGFVDFSHIEGGENYPHCNLGIYDQIEALRWVQKNIAAFGGDPDRVTIFGESAGGGSVSAIAVMKEARGLFKRVIAQSGSVALCTTRATATVPIDNLAKAFNAKNMDDLLAIPAEKITEFWQSNSGNGYNFALMDDCIFGGRDPFELWDEGATKDLDILQGFMADEWRLFLAAFQPKAFYDAANKDIAQRLYDCGNDEYKKLYSEYLEHIKTIEDPAFPGIEFVNEYLFGAGCRHQATAHAKNGGRGYAYIITQPSSVPALGACHGVDIFFTFGAFDGKVVKETPENRAFSRKLQKIWTNFAKTGDPSTDDLACPMYDEISHATMVLGPETQIINDPRSKRRELTEKMGRENPPFNHPKSLSDLTKEALEHYPEFKK